MGGIDSFKRDGPGIILYDNGACSITYHTHDVMINHSIIFRDRSITSILVNSNRTRSVCFRSGSFLLYFNMSSKGIMEGNSYFVHHYFKKVYKIKYDRTGKIIVKQRILDDSICRKLI
jgi:hypothetical protein